MSPNDPIRSAFGAHIHAALTARAPVGVAVAPGTPVFEAGLLDSVTLTELVADVERAFDLEIDFVEVDPDLIVSVDDLVNGLFGAATRRRG